MKRIAVMTSGGDAPGMNAAIRAVIRMGRALDLETFGIYRGYAGLIDGDIRPMLLRDVGGIIGRGGTILQSARCKEFETPAGQDKAVANLRQQGIDGVVIIGGNGTHKGAHALVQLGLPLVTIPSTIDNDLCYTDVTLGVDTALNTLLDAIDRIRDTASAHRRAFLIETMGRDSGYLALMAGVAGGAEVILIPEAPMKPSEVVDAIQDAYARGKAHTIIVCAEGYKPGTQALANYLKMREDELGFTVRMTILGHIQRGGSPTAFERLLATRFGMAAVQNLVAGQFGVMVGIVGNKIIATPIEKVVQCKKDVDLNFYDLANFLERGRIQPSSHLTAAGEPPSLQGTITVNLTKKEPEGVEER